MPAIPPHILNSMLIVAVGGDDADEAAKYLRSGADPNTVHVGETVLSAAAAAGSPELVAVLLKAGAKPDIPDGDGYTALFHAIEAGQFENAALLIAAGADINFQHRNGESRSILFGAVNADIRKGGDARTLFALMHGADPDMDMTINGHEDITPHDYLTGVWGDKRRAAEELIALLDKAREGGFKPAPVPPPPAPDHSPARKRLQARVQKDKHKFRLKK